MMHYDQIDFSEGINANKTAVSKNLLFVIIGII